jgi:hypothetical protein
VAEDAADLHDVARLGWDPVRRDAAAAPRKLVADVDDAAGEVDVVPAEAEYFREPHACVRAGDEQRPVSARAGGEEPGELRAGEDALLGAERVWPLVALKPVERVRGDVVAAVTPSISATSPARKASTSRRTSTARCRGGSRCSPVTNASPIASRVS